MRKYLLIIPASILGLACVAFVAFHLGGSFVRAAADQTDSDTRTVPDVSAHLPVGK